ncbi:MAG: excalibur calcium-binding domain-containing protein [Proteobacteria bacterium]|nr:excalibur calcium-binding domain-containing protein [Pseudomonadota bacterium]
MKNLLASVAFAMFGVGAFAAQPFQLAQSSSSQPLRCDGRTHCSQMSSCEEAKYFLKNCPGVKMDGDGNGIPCERQWCTAEPRGKDESERGRRRLR